jgi:hypothetical protein
MTKMLQFQILQYREMECICEGNGLWSLFLASLFLKGMGYRLIYFGPRFHAKVDTILGGGFSDILSTGPFYHLAGSYNEPLGSDEDPETFGIQVAPSLHTDHVFADQLRLVNWEYATQQLVPSVRIAGFVGHQTERVDAKGDLVCGGWPNHPNRDGNHSDGNHHSTEHPGTSDSNANLMDRSTSGGRNLKEVTEIIPPSQIPPSDRNPIIISADERASPIKDSLTKDSLPGLPPCYPLNRRDWDLLGFKYNFFSNIATAGLNAVS